VRRTRSLQCQRSLIVAGDGATPSRHLLNYPRLRCLLLLVGPVSTSFVLHLHLKIVSFSLKTSFCVVGKSQKRPFLAPDIKVKITLSAPRSFSKSCPGLRYSEGSRLVEPNVSLQGDNCPNLYLLPLELRVWIIPQLRRYK